MFKYLYLLLKTLDQQHKKKVALAILLVIAAAICDAVSLSLVGAFAVLLTSSNSAFLRIPFLIKTVFQPTDYANLLSKLSISISIAAILTSYVRTLSTKYSSLVAAALGAYLNKLYLEFIFNKRLEDFQILKKTDIISVLANSNIAINSYITPALSIASSLSTLALYALAMIIVAPYITICFILASSVMYLLIFVYSSRFLKSISVASDKLFREEIETVSTMVDSYRDIKLHNLLGNYLQRFHIIDAPYRKKSALVVFISTLPRFAFEAVGLAAIGIFSFFLIKSGQNAKLLTLLGIVIIAIQRLLPAIQQIYSSYSSMKGNVFSILPYIQLKPIQNSPLPFDMKTILKSQRSSETTQNSRDLISIQKITYTHRKSKHSEVISELSLSINLGDKVALVGSSGSGKSTLLDIISNLLAPSKGKIYYNWPSNGIGQYHSQEDILPGVNQHKIFHLHQKPCIINKTIRENILFPYEEDAFNSCAYQKACDVVELNTMLKQCGYTENQVLGDNGSGLSGGQLQRIGLARALYHNPILLLLDESTSALDIISETLILSRILKYYPKTTLVFVTHRVNSLKEFNKIHVLNQGSIISSGTYSELIKTCPLFSNLSKSGL